MTEQKIVLTHSGYQHTVKKVLETAITMFFPDKGAETLDLYTRIEIGKYVKSSTMKRDLNTPNTKEKKSWFHKTEFVAAEETEWTPVLVADWKTSPESVLTVRSNYLTKDDAAIWIAGQLEKIFDKIIVYVNDPTKLGHAIGWRCAYCNTMQTTKKCENCGAPRAW